MSALFPAFILLGLLAALVWFARGDIAEYRLFQALRHSDARQARYRRWMAKAVFGFALPALLALALLGRLDALVAMPPEFATLAAALPSLALGEAAPAFLIGMTLGVAIVAALTRLRRGRLPPTLGKVGALMPRTRRELGWGAALALTAGVTEEAMFRLALPLVTTLVTGSALAGFVAATIAFGVLHRYQGWVGVLATGVVGGFFAFLYLASGQLWLVMALHALLDLNGLVLRPVLGGAWARRD